MGLTVFEKAMLVVGIILVVACLVMFVVEERSISGKVVSPLVEGSKVYSIDIRYDSFYPEILDVNKGDTVVWTNKDEKMHEIQFNGYSLANSRPLEEGALHRYQFNEPGTYSYHCSVHPGLQGLIRVLEE